MSNITIRKRRGTTLEMAGLVAQPGEVFIDLTKPTLVVHDGTTLGGIPLAKENHSHANATTLTAGFMSTDDKSKLDTLSLGGGIQNVLNNTVPVTARNTANFSTDFAVTDNSTATRTEFAISQSFRDEVNSNAIALIIALN